MDMMDLIMKLWPLKRSLVSDDYDKALSFLCEEVPLEIDEFPSGKECWTWVIPEKWTCREAYLESLGGERIIDYQSNPLHCVEYSTSFEGIVTRDELFRHLYVHPSNPEAIPYVFKFYERDWGLCCSKEQKEGLSESKYRVVIRTDFEKGSLKVGKWCLPGQSEQVFILTAHLCHPCMANDDLSGVAVGLKLMERLAAIGERYYTCLLLLVPETIGSIAWLSHNEELIPKMKAGVFLEMLGTDLPLSLQRSYFGNTQLDLCCEDIISAKDKEAYVRDFWEVVRNDELEYNSPGVRVPMVSISRVLPPEKRAFPYPEYHTHFDTAEIIDQKRLIDSVEIVFEILSAFDRNCYPKANFKGQVFCSRYDLFPKDPEAYNVFFKTLFDLDGEHSIIDIALKHGFGFDSVIKVVESLKEHDLVSLIRR